LGLGPTSPSMIAGTLTAFAAVSVLAFFMRSQLRQLHSYGALPCSLDFKV